MADEKWWEQAPLVDAGNENWWEAAPLVEQPKTTPTKPQGIASKIAEFGLDLGKRAAGAVVGGVASIPAGVQSGIRSAVRNAASADADVVMPAGVYQPGLDTDATVHGPETQLDSDKRLLQGELTAKAVRLPGADALAQAGKEKQQAINETVSQATKDAVANTRITGNLLKGEIDFGKDPSLRGFVMQGADVFGSILPVVATALVTRSPNAAGAVGGAMAAGEGAGNAKEYVAKMTDAQLQEHSPLYQRMVSAGATPAQAREIVSARAEDASALLQGAVATLGDRFTGSLVTGGLDKALTRVAGKSVLGRAAAGGALSSLEEGTQELSEGVASDIGTKAAVRNKEVGEDSAANFVLGAIGGGAPGAVRGAVARGDAPADAAAQELPQPAPTVVDAAPVDAPPVTQAEAAGAAPVGVPTEAATAAPSAADPLARLAELEIINEQRDLTPDERQEAAALLSRLDDEQDASQGTQGAQGALANEGASAQAAPDQAAENAAGNAPAASGVPAAGGNADVQAAGVEAAPVDADSRSVLPQVAGPAPTNFWSFAKSKGLTPGQIQVGSPEHQALKAEYDALRAGGSEPVLPSLQPPQDVNLQNRDRGRAASVVQMAEIARNPDYMRLGPSRTPDSGAPMVFAVGDDLGVIPTENFGREDMAVMSDGQRVPFRYAVVDATKVNPSNFADGRTNPDFSSGAPGVLKALNNGRTAGIRAAHEMGTAGEYVQGVQADAAMHGVSPDVVARTPNPMLVRIYADAENTAGMAAKSQGQGLGMSPAELARQDAPLLDASVLSAYQPGDVTSAANRDFVRAFVGRLNASGLDIAGMMTGDGQLSQDGRKRIQAALMQAAYGDADLVEEMFDSTDTDIKAIGEALKTVAGQWANMRDSARLGVINPEVDITQNLLQAVGLIRKARRDGMSLYDLVNQPDLMTGEPPDALTVGALRMFYSGFYLTRALGKDRLAQNLNAFVRGAMATSADAGIFGEVVSPGDILAAIIPITEGQANAEAQSEESIREPVGSVDTGGGPGEGQSGIGRPGPEEGGAGPDQDRGSEPGQNAPVGAQQQAGPGGESSQEGDAADEGRPERGQQGGIAREAGAVAEAPAGDGQGDPAPLLESYTPEELAAREDAQAAAERQRASAAAEAESRAQVDAERDGFALTGSDRPADVLEAQGQAPMFSRAGNPDSEAQRQFKETERAYGGREAYDRAKAAGKTKLTYGQWVQVRTPNFKAWFGDWEAVRAQERLDSMKPMQVRVPDAWRGLGHAELRQKMAEELDRMVREKTQIEHPELGMIQVGRAGVKKTSGSARDPAKSLVAADIEALIPASIYARTEPSRGGDGPDIEGYSTLLARVDVDGVPLVASFTVRHQSDGQWYYNAVALHDGKEKAQDSYGRPDQQTGSRFAPIAGLSGFIRRPLARVNPEEVSKVVDSATGEPLVVYHGTNSDLSAFASDRANYFTADPGAASVYAEGFGAPREGANVSPVYLSIQRPKWMPLTDSAKLTAADLAAIKEEGFDGVFGWTLDTGMGGPTPIAREVGTGQRGMDKIVTEAIPLSPEQIKSATGNNGNFDARNPDIRYSFAGQQAATADQHALATAQQRLDAGEDAEAVRQDTGWFKGVDGKWRFEINDADAKLLKEPSDPGVYADIFDEAASRSNGVPLGKVLDHPALFAAYPALKATRFIVDDQYGGNGSYSADENAIRVRDPYSYKNGPDQLLSVLLHEIQHGIQNIEGFATGGNQDSRADVMQAVSQQRTLWADVYAVRRELDAGKKLDAVLEEWQEFLDAQPSAEALRIAQDPELETSVALQNMETLERQYAQLRNEGRGDTYRRLAGEVEARNTQARQGMTDEQRRATPPSQTADVADSRVIVMFNGKVAENAPMPANLRASRGRPGSMTESAVRQVASTIAARWAQSPPVVVVQSMQDMRVPEAARLEDARQRAGGASGSPRGFYYRGQVYLVADGLTSVRDAAETLFHEALGHHGLRAMFGNTLDGILDQIAMARPDLMKPKAEEYGKDLKVQKQRREVAEEVLAELSQVRPDIGFVKRAIAVIRTWLRENVPYFNNLKLTDAEIVNNYILPARGWVERGARSAQPASAIAFSRGTNEAMTNNDVVGNQGGRSADDSTPGAMFDAQAAFEKHGGIGDVDESTDITAKSLAFAEMAESQGWTVVGRGDKYVTLKKHFGLDGEGYPKNAVIKARISDHSNVNRGVHFGEIDINIAPDDGYGRDTFEDALRKIRSAYVTDDLDTVIPNEPAASDGSDAPMFSRTPGDQTQTDAFKRWFKDSKVVDAEGNPLVVYHGTGADFSEFSASKIGSVWGADTVGFFFTDSAKIASSYATSGGPTLQRDEGANIIPAYIRISRPVTVEALEAFTGESGLADAYESPIELMDERRDDIMSMLLGNEQDDWSIDKDSKPSVNNTHDGVIFSFGGSTLVVAVDPAQIKSATGNSGAFDPANPDIRFSRSTLGNAPAPLPQNPTPLQKLKAKALQLTSPQAITSLIYEYQDKNIDLKRLRDHIKELGGTITDLNDAYLGEELYHKRLAKRTQDFLSEELKPLLADLRARGLDLPTLEQFLHARHAPEANKVLAERNPNAQMIDAGRNQAQQAVRALEVQLQRAKAQGTATKAIEDALTEAREEASRWKGAQAFKGTEDERTSLSGMSDAAAKAFMDGLQPGQRVHLDALAARVDAINAKTLDTLEKYGLMDKASMDAWRNTYQHYVPLRRDEAHPDAVSHPIGQGFSTKGAASKRRTGSNEKVTNILAHIAMQRESALTRGEKNRVAKKLYLMAAQNPDPEVWAVDKPPMTKTVDSETGFVRTNVDPTYKNKPNVVMVRIGGKDQAIVFNERNPEAVRLAQSIKNQDVGDLGRVMRASARFTRFFAAMSTQYNPVFTVVNFVRDLQGGVINLSSTQIADRKRQVFMGIGPALRAIYADVRAERKGGTGPQNQWAQLWDEMQNEGGTTGYRDLFADPAERVKAIEKELAKIDRGDTARLVDWYVTGWVSDMNEAVENAVRLSAYKAARDSGMSKEQSASLAKNITVNFNRKGRLGAHANALYAFFNAAVQGNTRMLQTLSSPMGRKIILGGIALGVLNTMLMVSMLGGDGEDDEYKNLPEFVKSRNLMIPLGGKDYLTVPLPLGLHVLPNIGRLATEFAMGYHQDKGLGGVLGEVMTLVMDAFNPLGGSENVAMVIAPTPLDIPVGIAMNRDWQNRPIARENMSELDPEPAHKLTRDSATIFSKKASELLNAMGGGDEYTPGAKITQWTPDQIDYVVSQLTGGLGREMVKSLQTVNATMTGDELPDYKIPLWGRFKGSTEGPAGQSMQYSENVRKLNIVENSIKGRARDEAEGTLGSNKTAAEYMAGEPLSDLVGVGNAAERQIAKLRQHRASIQRRAEPGYQDEVKQINEQIAEVMTSLNREVSRAKKEAATN